MNDAQIASLKVLVYWFVPASDLLRSPGLKFMFVIFIIISTWALLSVMTGVGSLKKDPEKNGWTVGMATFDGSTMQHS